MGEIMNADAAKFKIETVTDKFLWKLYMFQQLALSSVIKTVNMFYLKITPIYKV